MREVLRTRLDSLPAPLVRTGAWLCLILLGVLSWLPSTMLKRTGLAGQIEHLFAYACAAAALTLGYQHSPRWRLMAGLVAYAAVLEVGQLYVPGRHAAVIDWAASSLGAVLGVLAMASLMQPPPRQRPRWVIPVGRGQAKAR